MKCKSSIGILLLTWVFCGYAPFDVTAFPTLKQISMPVNSLSTESEMQAACIATNEVFSEPESIQIPNASKLSEVSRESSLESSQSLIPEFSAETPTSTKEHLKPIAPIETASTEVERATTTNILPNELILKSESALPEISTVSNVTNTTLLIANSTTLPELLSINSEVLKNGTTLTEIMKPSLLEKVTENILPINNELNTAADETDATMPTIEHSNTLEPEIAPKSEVISAGIEKSGAAVKSDAEKPLTPTVSEVHLNSAIDKEIATATPFQIISPIHEVSTDLELLPMEPVDRNIVETEISTLSKDSKVSPKFTEFTQEKILPVTAEQQVMSAIYSDMPAKPELSVNSQELLSSVFPEIAAEPAQPLTLITQIPAAQEYQGISELPVKSKIEIISEVPVEPILSAIEQMSNETTSISALPKIPVESILEIFSEEPGVPNAPESRKQINSKMDIESTIPIIAEELTASQIENRESSEPETFIKTVIPKNEEVPFDTISALPALPIDSEVTIKSLLPVKFDIPTESILPIVPKMPAEQMVPKVSMDSMHSELVSQPTLSKKPTNIVDTETLITVQPTLLLPMQKSEVTTTPMTALPKPLKTKSRKKSRKHRKNRKSKKSTTTTTTANPLESSVEFIRSNTSIHELAAKGANGPLLPFPQMPGLA